MTRPAHGDFETYSVVDLTRAGLHRYALHPLTGVWCLSWRIASGNSPVNRFNPAVDEDPWELLAHVQEGGMFIAHNAPFEHAIWNQVMRRDRPYWPELRLEQMNCTMARAQAIGLPGKLEKVAPVLGSPIGKDMEGSALMLRVCRPRKYDENGNPVWWNTDPTWPVKIERLQAYCDKDVEVETFVDDHVPQLTASERAIWELDQKINRRGVKCDIPLVKRCELLAEEAKRRANRAIHIASVGAIKKVSETGKIVKFLQDRNIPCKSIAKGEHDDLLIYTEVMDDPIAKRVIEIRRDGYKSSTAKFPAMVKVASPVTDRLHYLLAYFGATTGRWGGRLVQPQNFPRTDPDRDLPTVLEIIRLLQTDMPIQAVCDIVELLYGEAMPWLAKMLRSMLIADEGKEFVGGDLSNIEGRIAAWLAGEQWKLDAFRAFDQGVGEDLYKLAYARSFNVPVDTVGKGMKRQLGKVQELALGYQGSVGAFVSMVSTYQLKLYEIAAAVREAADPRVWDATAAQYEKRKAYGLPEDWWTACKILVDAWRKAHPHICQAWWDVQDAAIEAVLNPGRRVEVLGGRVAYAVIQGALLCRIPSGRVLTYWEPRVVSSETEIEVLDDDGNLIEIKTVQGNRRQVEFSGLHKKTKQWSRLRMYGGLQFENIDQATARDVMVAGMFRVEERGYPLVLTVHDELLAEVPEGYGSVDEFASLMATNDNWNLGLPLAAAAWRDRRYTK